MSNINVGVFSVTLEMFTRHVGIQLKEMKFLRFVGGFLVAREISTREELNSTNNNRINSRGMNEDNYLAKVTL